MDEAKIVELKKSIIAIGRLLWEKDLVTGLNGNISVRLDDNTILITATKTCLGLLHDRICTCVKDAIRSICFVC